MIPSQDAPSGRMMVDLKRHRAAAQRSVQSHPAATSMGSVAETVHLLAGKTGVP